MHLFERLAVDKHGKPVRRSRPYSTLDTFNILLRGAAKPVAQKAFDLAMFLVSEMLAIGVRPDSLVYNRLIVICVQDEKLDHAYRYFDEMEELGFMPRPRTAELLAKTLAEGADGRCWEVLQRMQDRGAGLAERQRISVQHTFSRAQENRNGELQDIMA
jgi:pentatricopeptide repeat protein